MSPVQNVKDVPVLSELPLPAREECVRSMFYLYRDLFAIEPSETAGFMWWDSICWHLWHRGRKDRQRGGEELSMQDVMFETLVEILALDSENCQCAALHGLGSVNTIRTAATGADFSERAKRGEANVETFQRRATKRSEKSAPSLRLPPKRTRTARLGPGVAA